MTDTDSPVADTEVQTAGFRVIIRGKNPAGRRPRFTRTIHVADFDAAHEQAGAIAEQIVRDHKLDPMGLFINIYPPTGIRCDGKLSKGHGVVDGFVVKLKTPAVVAPAPAVKAKKVKTPVAPAAEKAVEPAGEAATDDPAAVLAAALAPVAESAA